MQRSMMLFYVTYLSYCFFHCLQTLVVHEYRVCGWSLRLAVPICTRIHKLFYFAE